MGKREKLIERLTNSPQNATFADIRNLLEYEGFYLDSRSERLRQRVTGSHHIFKYAETTFVIPVHNNRVKAIYVRKVLELIESADTELEEEED
jgi:predicted RNA binding protein YcfA (HicA-like mRNA interferase family)